MRRRMRQGGNLDGLVFEDSSAYMECPDGTALRAATVRGIATCLGVACGNYIQMGSDSVCRLKAELAQIDPDHATADALRVAIQSGQVGCSLDGAFARVGNTVYEVSILPPRSSVPAPGRY